MELMTGSDGQPRCSWPGEHGDYLHYHDTEWGRPTVTTERLFEKICLEGFQSGLSWLTILRKRDNFRRAFADFNPERVAAFGGADVERLLGDAGIVRHRGKIEATVNNAQRALELIESEGGGDTALVNWIWSWAVAEPERTDDGGIPASSAQSTALAMELKRRGWRFFGPITAYAFMQSEGLTSDHHPDCFVHDECDVARTAFLAGYKLR